MATPDTLARPEEPLIAGHFSAVADRLPGRGLGWLERQREQARADFRRLGIPTTKHEEWRYTPLRDFSSIDFAPRAIACDVPELASHPIYGIEAFRLVFKNGVYDPDGGLGECPMGVRVLRLADALAQEDPLVRDHLGQYAKAHEHPFVALNTALFEDGVVVHVSRNAVVETPIHLVFASKTSHAPFAAHPRVLIVVEPGAEATVLESHLGFGGVYLSNPVVEVIVGENAKLEHTKLQDESLEAYHIATIDGLQGSDSVYTSNSVQYGAKLGRTDLNVFLNGQNVECWLNGVYVGMGSQLLDNHTRLDHAQPNGNSFEVYKGILDERSNGVFNGKIYVHQDAQKTDAKQTNQALLLSRNATIETKPQLEIYADDVKCTHGATVGQLDAESTFYLRSRGIPEATAKSLLTYAFASEVLERIGNEAVREITERMLYAKLGGGFPA
ncbi:MAG: Fe-S cluster assembly protein SufD [Fimbriimonadaceae bacterium]|nr:Fe-S cluster assembly protein SufD [Fimbriimonadaceae bacterium]